MTGTRLAASLTAMRVEMTRQSRLWVIAYCPSIPHDQINRLQELYPDIRMARMPQRRK